MTKTKTITPKKGGRPTKYKPEYCQAILDYFDIEAYRKEVMGEKKELYANGNEKTREIKYQLIANRMPSLFRFAMSIDVNQDTLHEWASKHPEFSEAMRTAKEMQQEFLIDAGMSGSANAAMTIFTAKNVTSMRDKVETVNTNHNVFFVPKEIAEKHGLTLPQATPPASTIHIPADEVRVIEPEEPEVVTA